MKRGSSSTEILSVQNHGLLPNSKMFGSAKSLNEQAFSELVFETVGKHHRTSSKKNREHRATLPDIRISEVEASCKGDCNSVPGNADSNDSQKRKSRNLTLEEGASKASLSPEAVTSKISRSPSFRRKKIDQPPPECNIVLLGALGVGKTALAVRFVTKRYLHEYDSTLERTYERLIDVEGENIHIKLWDTVNKEWDNLAESADAFAVVYSITSMDSYKHATRAIKAIRSSCLVTPKQYPVMMIGNKMEMEQGRSVRKETAECFAAQNACSFSEISVATNCKVESVFNYLIKQFRNSKHPTTEQRKQGTSKYSLKSFLSKNMSKIK